MNIENKEVTSEAFQAGALIKFDKLEEVDLKLLIEDFEEKTGYKVVGRNIDVDNLMEYIDFSADGTRTLKESIPKIEVKYKLRRITEDVIIDYFSSIDTEDYLRYKKEVLKQEILDKVNVLLISDREEDYQSMIDFGFKNIDFFRSIIRANNYFMNHKEELKKYRLIVKGNQSVESCCFGNYEEVERLISEQWRLTPTESIDINIYESIGAYDTYLRDKKNHRSWHVKEKSYADLWNKVIINMISTNVLEGIDLNNEKFIPLEDNINPNRLPLPKKKKDLKILYLGAISIPDKAERINEELGLDIEFKEDNNYTLSKVVKRNLGNYDIIIASQIYSGNILGMNKESTEQCKDTGRDLTLLATYQEDYMANEKIGNSLKLRYICGGLLANNNHYTEKDFKAPFQDIEVDGIDSFSNQYKIEKYSKTKTIIEAVVNLYNDALIEAGKDPLEDLDLRNADTFDEEYNKKEEEFRQQEELRRQEREKHLAPIRLFDKLKKEVMDYLKYSNNGILHGYINGLEITELKDAIRLEIKYDGICYGALTFKKAYKEEDLRVFEVQYINKKGYLSYPQTYGLYTKKYESLESIPPRLDDKGQKVLSLMEKKISSSISPLNEVARKRINEYDRPKRRSRSYYKKNY